MKLYFHPGDAPWRPQRYRYPVEQMLLTLFPVERPEYPAEEPEMGTDCAVFSLRGEGERLSAAARVCRKGETASGEHPLPAGALSDTPERIYHVLGHALKMAFYRAGTALLGYEPPWGALTGVRPVKLPARALAAGATPAQAQRELEEIYRVSPVRAALALRCARASLEVGRTLGPDQVSLYVGIPFCPSRCAYCSFISADAGRSLKLVEPYLEALFREIDCTGRILREIGLSVRSVYVGGGTPTALTAEQLDSLLGRMEEQLPLEGRGEFTVEAGRPDTVTWRKLAVLREHGVDRISINPQTLDDRVLALIGRRHTAEDVFSAYQLAREFDFDCVNMDLIAGLPGDSPEGFLDSLGEVMELTPGNITVHTLALKKGSRLMERGGALPSGDEVAKMLEGCLECLPAAGYLPYYLYRQKYMSGALENVGWARPGRESVYNVVMMEELQSVVSLGCGGVTKLVGGGRILRLANPKYPQDYLSGFKKVLAQKEELPAFFRAEQT